MAVDPKAADAELLVDRAYLGEALISRGYSEAVFRTLVVAEHLLAKATETATRQEHAIAIDNIINALKYGLGWIWKERNAAKSQPSSEADPHREAQSLLRLASGYITAFAAFANARRDVIDLWLEDKTFRATGQLLNDTRYEAYNLLLKPSIEQLISEPEQDETPLIEAVSRAQSHNVTLEAIPTTRRVLEAAFEIMNSQVAPFYQLPPNWSFGPFSLRTFRATHTVVVAILFTWKRIAALLQGKVPYGPSLPFVIPKRNLVAAVKDITQLPKNDIRAVLNLLEYASNGIETPDPALQPLIDLGGGNFVLSAPLVLGTAAERNLTVLLNMLPGFKDAYSRLTNEKEAAMRSRITQRIPAHFSTWYGKLPGRADLPNVDLAICDPQKSSVLLLELKWFLDPAEVREVIRRSEELAKGVKQCRQLLVATSDHPHLLNALPGAPFKSVTVAVVSANWIGHADVQHPDVVIINEEHLARKIEASKNLEDVTEFLNDRAYLPLEGVQFRTTQRNFRVGEWQFDWYGIDPLVERFIPL